MLVPQWRPNSLSMGARTIDRIKWCIQSNKRIWWIFVGGPIWPSVEDYLCLHSLMNWRLIQIKLKNNSDVNLSLFFSEKKIKLIFIFVLLYFLLGGSLIFLGTAPPAALIPSPHPTHQTPPTRSHCFIFPNYRQPALAPPIRLAPFFLLFLNKKKKIKNYLHDRVKFLLEKNSWRSETVAPHFFV